MDHVLKASLERGWIITIIYQKDDLITKRNIKVLSIKNNTIKAYCYLRQNVRVFQRENILAASFCNTKLEKEKLQIQARILY
jgi:sarcosine oxidase delta subunit